MARPEASAASRPRPGEWAIAGTMLAFFLLAFLVAQDWPFRAALFPLMISTLGTGLSVLRLVQLVVLAVRARRHVAAVTPVQAETAAAGPAAAPPTAQSLADLALEDDEADDDESMEYVFASAGRRAWAAALAWIAGFFVAFFVLGAFIALPLFALTYLRFAGRASWRAAAAYAAVTGLITYVVFRELVYVPLPESVFPFLDI